MLADELVGRNLYLAAAFAPHVDDLAPTEIIKRRVCPVDEASAHHSPGVECGGSGGRLMMSHRASFIRSMIAVARNDGRRRSNFGPRCRRSTSLAAQAIGHSGDSGSGRGSVSGICPYENKTGTSATDHRLIRPMLLPRRNSQRNRQQTRICALSARRNGLNSQERVTPPNMRGCYAPLLVMHSRHRPPPCSSWRRSCRACRAAIRWDGGTASWRDPSAA
jgi:hypothetical protein